jgi:hypothetical protein
MQMDRQNGYGMIYRNEKHGYERIKLGIIIMDKKG